MCTWKARNFSKPRTKTLINNTLSKSKTKKLRKLLGITVQKSGKGDIKIIMFNTKNISDT
jgi:hypothetical protein